MITADTLRDRLRASPFQPFRFRCADGSVHGVPHPEFAWLLGRRIFVARVIKDGGTMDVAVKQVELASIEKLAPIPKADAQRQRRRLAAVPTIEQTIARCLSDSCRCELRPKRGNS